MINAIHRELYILVGLVVAHLVQFSRNHLAQLHRMTRTMGMTLNGHQSATGNVGHTHTHTLEH